MKFITIDIEGDARVKQRNQLLFPKPPHYDPETRLWCCSICYNGRVKTYVCKLPPTTRILPDGSHTGSFHLSNTKVPKQYKTVQIVEIKEYVEFLQEISKILAFAKNTGYAVYFKGYGKYNYDKDMLNHIFNKFGISTYGIDNMVNVHKYTIGKWPKTHEQVGLYEKKPNQEFICDGIKHNIEDTLQLYNIMNEITK